MDINSPHTVDKYVPEMTKATLLDKDCKERLFCGVPYLVPVLSLISKTHWIPGPMPYLATPVKMSILKRETLTDGERIIINVEGKTIFTKCVNNTK